MCIFAVPVTHVFSLSDPANVATSEGEAVGSRTNTGSAIDYSIPLMNSLESLIQDNYQRVVKPTGVPGTIAVPLMSYSSCTEQGTVFGVEDPGSAFAPFIEPESHNANNTMRNEFSNTFNTNLLSHFNNPDEIQTATLVDGVESPITPETIMNNMAHSNDTNAVDVSPSPNNENTELPIRSSIRTSPIYINPLTKIITRRARPGNDPARPINHRANGPAGPINNRLRIISDIRINDTTPATLNNLLQARPVRQYTNTKRINLMQKRGSLLFLPSTEITLPNVTAGVNASPATASANTEINQHGMNTSNITDIEMVEYDHGTNEGGANTITPNNIQNSMVNSGETSEDTSQALPPPTSDDTGSNDIIFTPYTQYHTLVNSDTPNAHIGAGTMDYGLPLMNCVATIFQGDAEFSGTPIDPNAIEEVIDVPLLQCLKILDALDMI